MEAFYRIVIYCGKCQFQWWFVLYMVAGFLTITTKIEKKKKTLCHKSCGCAMPTYESFQHMLTISLTWSSNRMQITNLMSLSLSFCVVSRWFSANENLIQWGKKSAFFFLHLLIKTNNAHEINNSAILAFFSWSSASCMHLGVH